MLCDAAGTVSVIADQLLLTPACNTPVQVITLGEPEIGTLQLSNVRGSSMPLVTLLHGAAPCESPCVS
jgi:hypothetical protein